VLARLRSRARSEAGVSTLEVVIATVVLAIASLALTGSLTSATHASTYAQRRNEALDDLRVMAASFSKDVRQGIEVSTAEPDELTFSTYIDDEVHDVTWRAVTSGGEERLERVIDGTIIRVFVVDLTTPAIFSYFGEADPASVSRVRLNLATQIDDRFDAVELATEVEMRNVV